MRKGCNKDEKRLNVEVKEGGFAEFGHGKKAQGNRFFKLKATQLAFRVRGFQFRGVRSFGALLHFVLI